MRIACLALVLCVMGIASGAGAAPVTLDLGRASALATPDAARASAMPLRVLREEVVKRTGIPLNEGAGSSKITLGLDAKGLAKEGFRIEVVGDGLSIVGADTRGLLYGVGWFLRHMDYGAARLMLTAELPYTSTPVYAIRGHQLGYRATANSWDAWTVAQFDQYIRELALFGANSIESIPFHDDRANPHFKYSREFMNKKMSEICADYDLDYWAWIPADFDLKDAAKRKAAIERDTAFYKDCKRLDAIFFPGGDPGDNHPREVLPFLADLSKPLAKYHPHAKLWLSLQGYTEEQTKFALDWIAQNKPTWFGGLVHGPSSPSIILEREALPAQYPIRSYPDLTHTVRCQYPVTWWDPAFAKTLGRECINPRPSFYAQVHNTFAPYTVGFLSYSDGVHDDVNKALWSRLSFDPKADIRDIMREYASFFFGSDVAQDAADGILALEKNWEGPLAENGGVPATFALWQGLERRAPQLSGNWRWQMCLTRAYYDEYTRKRQFYEQGLEDEANGIMAKAGAGVSAEETMNVALAAVQKADQQNCAPDMQSRIVRFYEDLFSSVQLQSSMKRYTASGYERGCSLDFLDYPLNNRWWLEDEFKKIRAMATEDEKVARLHLLAAWEHPAPGSWYDAVGHPGKSQHVLRGEGLNTDPEMMRNPNPGDWWWDDGFSRQRLSFQTTMDWPLGLAYEALDHQATYMLRLTGYGQALVKADSQTLTPTVYGKEIGEFKEFAIPKELTADGALKITFDRPQDEVTLNWRKQSRLAEAWLLKQ